MVLYAARSRHRVRILLRRQVDVSSHGVLRPETGARVEQIVKAADQKSGADEQHERQCHLRDDERGAQPLVVGAVARCSAVVQRIEPLPAGGGESRYDRDDDRRRH